jgi:hypothetical protein
MANSIPQAHTQRDRTIPPLQITTFNASPESNHTSVDTSESSRLSDEKRARGARASARFRARKAKEREATEQGETKKQTKPEEIIKVSADQLPATHLSINERPQKTIWELCETFYHIPSRPGSIPPFKPLFLSPSQEAKLWWRSVASLGISNFAAFHILDMEFQKEFCTFINSSNDDESLCMRVPNYIKHHDEQVEGLDELLEMKSNISRIMSTINEQMGLDIAIFGWSCVCAVLRVSGPNLFTITYNSCEHI